MIYRTRTVLIFCALLCAFIRGLTGYELTIVHNNDVHAHYEQINKYAGECSEVEARQEKCYGGEARRVTFIKEARANNPNTLVLNAGDWYSGTLWFNHYKGQAAYTFVNREGYDAICLGNHEFDLGINGLVPYIDNLTVPLLDCNIDASGEPRLKGKWKKSIVKTLSGVKIGIIGVTTIESSYISSPGPTLKFHDEIESVRTEAKRLKAEGVPIIIVVSHSGYNLEQKMAAEVEEVDVVVGGHSHTFLYTGTPPSNDKSEGPYPTVVEQPGGRHALVVQAYAWGKYMGLLNVTFDADNNYRISSWAGQPVLLDKNIARDPDTLALINQMKKPLEAMAHEIVGKTLVRLDGDSTSCRLVECNAGNLITDAMVDYGARTVNPLLSSQWSIASIALLSGGGVRSSTEQGNITLGMVLTVLPFGNNVELVRIYGRTLRSAFENSVAKYHPRQRSGAFFQMSGIHVVYNLSQPVGSRVISLDALCLNCTVPVYNPVEDDLIYNVLMVDFTINGGDAYSMITNELVDRVRYAWLDADVQLAYLKRFSPIYAATEGRIKFDNSTETTDTGIGVTCPPNDQTSGGLSQTVSPINWLMRYVLYGFVLITYSSLYMYI